jgi:hypothetical protein
VRAVVLPLLDQEAAAQLHGAAVARLGALLGEGSVWWQDPALYHATVFHASTQGVGGWVGGESCVPHLRVGTPIAGHACCMHVSVLFDSMFAGFSSSWNGRRMGQGCVPLRTMTYGALRSPLAPHRRRWRRPRPRSRRRRRRWLARRAALARSGRCWSALWPPPTASSSLAGR